MDRHVSTGSRRSTTIPGYENQLEAQRESKDQELITIQLNIDVKVNEFQQVLDDIKKLYKEMKVMTSRIETNHSKIVEVNSSFYITDGFLVLL